MKEIQLTRNKVAIVDDEDYQKINQYKWWTFKSKYNNNFYASAKIDGKDVLMHRYILGLEDPKIQIDHKNRNALDNTRENLRIVSNQENSFNRGKNKNNKSGYKGVWFARYGYNYYKGKKTRYENTKPWIAGIKHNGKNKTIGYFATAEEAAKAYDIKAKELFGDFCYLNFP